MELFPEISATLGFKKAGQTQRYIVGCALVDSPAAREAKYRNLGSKLRIYSSANKAMKRVVSMNVCLVTAQP